MKLQSFVLLACLAANPATGHYVQEEDARSSGHVAHHNNGRSQNYEEHQRIRSYNGDEMSGGRSPKTLRGTGPETGEVRAGHYDNEYRTQEYDNEYDNEYRTQETYDNALPREEAPDMSSRSTEPDYDVLILGAGSAGLSAARTLEEAGWTSYLVLEAHASHIGGRTMGSTHEFGKEVDLGAEFIHTTGGKLNGRTDAYPHAYDLLQEMTPWAEPLDPRFRTEFTKEEPPLATVLDNGNTMSYHDPPEYRWAGGMSWHKFILEQVAGPAVLNKVESGCEVTRIHRDPNSGVVTATCGSWTYTAWGVIITVPMRQLQKGKISFEPAGLLPADYSNAFPTWNIANGFKIWLQYDQKWFPEYSLRAADEQIFRNSWNVQSHAAGNDAGYRLFWNEMFPYSDDNRAIIGGLIYGKPAEDYKHMSDEQVKDSIVTLLQPYTNDATFTGNWELMHWSNQPFVEGAYSIYANENSQWQLQQPIPSAADPAIQFAGEAINYNWGYVHGAAETGRQAAQKIMTAWARRR